MDLFFQRARFEFPGPQALAQKTSDPNQEGGALPGPGPVDKINQVLDFGEGRRLNKVRLFVQ